MSFNKKNLYWIIPSALILGTATTVAAFRFNNFMLSKVIEEDNLKKLNELHPKYRARFIKFFADLYKEGFTPLVTSGYRSIEKQNALHAADPNAAKGGSSLHNFALACDINIMKPKFIGMNTPDADWSRVVEIAKKNKLGWGGNLFGSSYHDRVHFQPDELKGKKGTELLALVEAGQVDKNGFVKLT